MKLYVNYTNNEEIRSFDVDSELVTILIEQVDDFGEGTGYDVTADYVADMAISLSPDDEAFEVYLSEDDARHAFDPLLACS